jgi:hypothetical protein
MYQGTRWVLLKQKKTESKISCLGTFNNCILLTVRLHTPPCSPWSRCLQGFCTARQIGPFCCIPAPCRSAFSPQHSRSTLCNRLNGHILLFVLSLFFSSGALPTNSLQPHNACKEPETGPSLASSHPLLSRGLSHGHRYFCWASWPQSSSPEALPLSHSRSPSTCDPQSSQKLSLPRRGSKWSKWGGSQPVASNPPAGTPPPHGSGEVWSFINFFSSPTVFAAILVVLSRE